MKETINEEKIKEYLSKYPYLTSENSINKYIIDIIPNFTENKGHSQALTIISDDFVATTDSKGYLYIKNTKNNQVTKIELGTHLGGISYKNGYLYVAESDTIAVYDFNSLHDGKTISKERIYSKTTTNNSESSQVSFLTTNENNELITGQFKGKEDYYRGGPASDLIKYKISEDGSLKETDIIKIPEEMTEIQGICTYNKNGEEYYLLTSSSGDNNNSKLYLAKLNNKTKELEQQKMYTLPPGAEQPTISNNKLSIIFEGETESNNGPCEDILVIDLNKMFE